MILYLKMMKYIFCCLCALLLHPQTADGGVTLYKIKNFKTAEDGGDSILRVAAYTPYADKTLPCKFLCHTLFF